MDLQDWSNWTVQERCIAEIIIEMFMDKNPSGTLGFQPDNIYEEYYDRLKAMWVPKPSLSADRQKAVFQILKVFVHRGVLIQQNETASLYYLSKDGCLYKELQRRTGNGPY